MVVRPSDAPGPSGFFEAVPARCPRAEILEGGHHAWNHSTSTTGQPTQRGPDVRPARRGVGVMSEATTDLATGGATDATWEGTDERGGLSRRNVLRISAAGAAAFGLGAGRLLLEPSLAQRGLASANGVFGAASIAWADLLYTEVFPTSPLILEPFKDALNVPK